MTTDCSNSQNQRPEVNAALSVVQHSLNQTLQKLFDLASQAELQASTAAVDRFASRWNVAYQYLEPRLRKSFQWLFQSREDTNFTYDLTTRNIRHIAAAVSV